MSVSETIDRAACDCRCHWNPYDHVPCCPVHSLPLHAADVPGWGECPATRRGPLPTAVRGAPGPRRSCGGWAPQEWLWLPRITFNGEDLPPFNGLIAPTTPEPGDGRWRVRERRCPACRARTAHVVGEHRLVCTRCGLAAWTSEVLR